MKKLRNTTASTVRTPVMTYRPDRHSSEERRVAEVRVEPILHTDAAWFRTDIRRRTLRDQLRIAPPTQSTNHRLDEGTTQGAPADTAHAERRPGAGRRSHTDVAGAPPTQRQQTGWEERYHEPRPRYNSCCARRQPGPGARHRGQLPPCYTGYVVVPLHAEQVC